MCGRYALYSSKKAIASAFNLSKEPDPTPRYNVAPSQPVSAVTQVADSDDSSGNSSDNSSGSVPDSVPDSERVYRVFQWGLIPSWAKDPAIGNRMINARAETAAEKPSFRSAFKRRRCLVIADGFYEWKKAAPKAAKGKKQPYFIQLADQSILGMAGLWERWQSADGSYIESCTILTTEPNSLMQTIHNRMPVILHPQDYDQWLDPTEQNRERLQPLLRPFEAEAMQMYPVSTTVNNPRNDSHECIERSD